jgi:hypothetical protein
VLSLSQLILKIAAGLYGLTLLTAFVFNPQRGLHGLLLLVALTVNAAAVVLRYRLAWSHAADVFGAFRPAVTAWYDDLYRWKRGQER